MWYVFTLVGNIRPFGNVSASPSTTAVDTVLIHRKVTRLHCRSHQRQTVTVYKSIIKDEVLAEICISVG
jgi:hypothetical protein